MDAEGYDAIMDPSDDRIWALRLNGQLLLGFARIHGLKVFPLFRILPPNCAVALFVLLLALLVQVQGFQDNLKTLHERLTIKFTPASIDLDISKSRCVELCQLFCICVPSPT
jgi:hypothetical protein